MKRILEHCPFYVPGNGKSYVVAANNGWDGYVGKHDWVKGVLGGGTPISSVELDFVRAGGGIFSWWEWLPEMTIKIEFPVDAAPFAYVDEPDPEPAVKDSDPEPDPPVAAAAVASVPKRRGRPPKAKVIDG